MEKKGDCRPTQADYQELYSTVTELISGIEGLDLRLDSLKILVKSLEKARFQGTVSPSQVNGFPEFDEFASYTILMVPAIAPKKVQSANLQNRRTLSHAQEMQSPADRKTHPLDSGSPEIQAYLCGRIQPIPTNAYTREFDLMIMENRPTYFSRRISKEEGDPVSIFLNEMNKRFKPKTAQPQLEYLGQIVDCIE